MEITDSSAHGKRVSYVTTKTSVHERAHQSMEKVRAHQVIKASLLFDTEHNSSRTDTSVHDTLRALKRAYDGRGSWISRSVSSLKRWLLGPNFCGWRSLAITVSILLCIASLALLCIALRAGAAQCFGYIELSEDSIPVTTQ